MHGSYQKISIISLLQNNIKFYFLSFFFLFSFFLSSLFPKHTLILDKLHLKHKNLMINFIISK